MKKVFLSYPFTGQNVDTLASILSGIVGKLEELGSETFCALLQKRELDDLGLIGYEARLAYCLEQQKKSDIVVAIILNEVPSNGMLQELIQAKNAGQEYLLLIKNDLSFSDFRNYAQQIGEYTHEQELPKLVQQLLLPNTSESLRFEFSE